MIHAAPDRSPSECRTGVGLDLLVLLRTLFAGFELLILILRLVLRLGGGLSELHEALVIVAVAQEPQGILDPLAPHAQQDFAMRLDSIDKHVAQRGGERILHAVIGRKARCGMENCRHQRSIVPARRIFRCNCITP